MKYIYPIKRLFFLSKKFGNVIAVDQANDSYNYRNFTNMVINLSKKILFIKERPVVAIIGEKNILSYVSIFSVLLAGGTYIPISANLPIKRITKIISSAKIDIIICQKKKIHTIKNKFKKKIFTEDILSDNKNFNYPKIKKINKIAYIIFTSGSTGEPKGVCISRKSLEHYIKWLNLNLLIKTGIRCSQFPEIGFDLSVADIFGTLCSGGTLCPADTMFSKTFPGRFIKNKKINFLICVPSLIDVIKNSGDLNGKNLISLKGVFFCGEPLLKNHVQSIFKVKKNIKIINSYGPTEATVSCTKKDVNIKSLRNNNFNSISIGKAIFGTKIELRNNGKLSKKEGEITIFGKQVAQGYLKKKENTGKFFFSNKRGVFYKTGDFVIVKKGEMYFKNRIDTQVKVKGHRIELDEITSNINKFGIKNVHTIILMDKIISFYSGKKSFNNKSILIFLKKYIPDYMMPNYIFKIKEFPLNQNGKLDINSLKKKARKKINEQ